MYTNTIFFNVKIHSIFWRRRDADLCPLGRRKAQLFGGRGGAPEVDSFQSDEAGQRRGEGRGPGRPDVVGAACIA